MDRMDQIELALVFLLKGFHIMNAHVQAVVTQVAASVDADTKLVTAVNSLVAQVADLNTKLTAAIANSFDQTDVDALVKVVADLTADTASVVAVTPK